MNITKEQLEKDFISSGERDRVTAAIIERLKSEGWVDEVKQLIRKEIKEQGIKDVDPNTLYEQLKGPARRLISNSTKEELFKSVKTWVSERTGVLDI
ncbi:unnamed protein product [Auanema sp. JU1783]|nr:unnamed protein product [Auanema sp. JU1783]